MACGGTAIALVSLPPQKFARPLYWFVDGGKLRSRNVGWRDIYVTFREIPSFV
jgi:hypothetical protein